MWETAPPRMPAGAFPVADAETSSIILGTRALWFQVGRRPPISLRKRGSLRRLLLALAELRQSDPAAELSVNAAFAAGWPGERAKPSAAAARVYTAVHTLRALGLRNLIVRRGPGYSLEADVHFAADDWPTSSLPREPTTEVPMAHAG